MSSSAIRTAPARRGWPRPAPTAASWPPCGISSWRPSPAWPALGYAHGDLSPYNLLVHGGRLVMIDLPQVVDVVSHPNGRGFLDRDARNVATWFAARGLPGADPERLARLLAEEARLA